MARTAADPDPPRLWLGVSEVRSGLVYEAGWLHRRAPGPARPGEAAVSGRHAAILAKDKLVREVEPEFAEQAAAVARERNKPATFRQVALAHV
jgi:hypothetical protein